MIPVTFFFLILCLVSLTLYLSIEEVLFLFLNDRFIERDKGKSLVNRPLIAPWLSASLSFYLSAERPEQSNGQPVQVPDALLFYPSAFPLDR